MKRRLGRRPWSITLFALLFLAAALHSYVTGLFNLELKQIAFAAMVPWDGWNQDWTIVTLSAVLSIAFIPVVWIGLFASRVAFWLVTVFTILKLLDLPAMMEAAVAVGGAVSMRYFLEPALLAGALVCLWLPASRTWLKPKTQAPVAGMFE